MCSIRTSVIASIAIGLASHGVALAAKVDDPTTFGQDAAAIREESALAERFFRIEWTAVAGRVGMSRISGYVYNDYGQAAQDVELRITSLNSAGQPVMVVVQHLSDTVPARGRGYFDLQIPVSSSYQVGVESFDFTLGHGRN